MTIGFSDGTTYDSAIGLHLGQERDNSYHKELEGGGGISKPGLKRDKQEWDFQKVFPKEDYRSPDWPIQKPGVEGNKGRVDREHHVPLLASATMDASGNMTGLAIDHRVRTTPDQDELLHLHEATELPYMNDLVKGGMKPSDAYAEAHKWATARETAASIAKWGPEGHEKYKEAMRENAAIAAEPTDRERHPDAHTTRYALDEHELGHEIKPLQIDVLGAGMKMHSGPMVSKPANVNKPGQQKPPDDATREKIQEFFKPRTVKENVRGKWEKLEEDLAKLPPDQQKYIKALGRQQGFATSLSDALAKKQRSKLGIVTPGGETQLPTPEPDISKGPFE